MISLASLGIICFWFYSLILIESVLLLFLIENNKPGWGTVSFFSTLGLIKVLAGINLFEMAWHNPGATLFFTFSYFVAGTAWAVGKWYLFVKERRARFDEAKAEYESNPDYFRSSHRASEAFTDPIKWTQSQKYKSFFEYGTHSPVPSVHSNKSRIMTWMGYWPWSMVWTTINNPIKKIFGTIYNRIYNSLQAISNNVFKDVK